MFKFYTFILISLVLLGKNDLYADCGDGANEANQKFRNAVRTCEFRILSSLLHDSSLPGSPDKVIDRSEKDASCNRYTQMAVFYWKTTRPVTKLPADVVTAGTLDVNCGSTLALLLQNGFQIDDPYRQERSAIVEAVNGPSCLLPAVKILIENGSQKKALSLAEAKKTRESAFRKLTSRSASKTDLDVYQGYVTACDQTIEYLESPSAKAVGSSGTGTASGGASNIGHSYGTSLAD